MWRLSLVTLYKNRREVYRQANVVRVPAVGRRVDVDQLVVARTIAERLGFKRVQLVHYYYRSDDTFPRPVFTVSEGVGGALVWYWPDVERWARRTGRLSEGS